MLKAITIVIIMIVIIIICIIIITTSQYHLYHYQYNSAILKRSPFSEPTLCHSEDIVISSFKNAILHCHWSKYGV